MAVEGCEATEKLERKIYIRYDTDIVHVRRQKTLKRNKCDFRKVCGTYGRTLSRKGNSKKKNQ